ncbi:DMT family transporter [Candidatus Saccharibacteria bacterium]|nr:DMT family transporter [Candidatus Saccharibacteria bacterium]
MNWQTLILLHAFVAAFQILQSRAIARIPKARHAALSVNAVAFTALFVIGIMITLFYGPASIQEVKNYWPFLTLCGICFTAGSVFMYKALVYMESAVVSVITTVTALFTLILAGVILNERLSLMQILGAMILIPTIWYILLLASNEKQGIKIHNRAWLRGLGFALTASAAFAAGSVLEKYSINHVSISTYIIGSWGTQVIMAWVFVLLLNKKSLRILNDPKIMMMSVRLGVIRSFAAALFLLAIIRSNNVTLMIIISNFRIIVVALLAGFFLGERQHYTQKLAAAAAAFLALGIIFWK